VKSGKCASDFSYAIKKMISVCFAAAKLYTPSKSDLGAKCFYLCMWLLDQNTKIVSEKYIIKIYHALWNGLYFLLLQHFSS
jgi:hypothetical protein